MNEAIKKDLLVVISSSLLALERQQMYKLDAISDQCLHNVSLYHDENTLKLAIIIYSLEKLNSRNQIQPIAGWDNILEAIHKHLLSARHHLNRDKIKAFEKELQKMLDKISKADQKIALYIDKILHKARIKKGRKIYEQGLSIGKTSELLDMNYWDFMSYIGKTQIIDKQEVEFDPKKRLDFTKKIFGLK